MFFLPEYPLCHMLLKSSTAFNLLCEVSWPPSQNEVFFPCTDCLCSIGQIWCVLYQSAYCVLGPRHWGAQSSALGSQPCFWPVRTWLKRSLLHNRFSTHAPRMQNQGQEEEQAGDGPSARHFKSAKMTPFLFPSALIPRASSRGCSMIHESQRCPQPAPGGPN